MKIYGLQKLTLLDYPGKTACTVFTGGCNFRCPFCHNASLVTQLDRSGDIKQAEVLSYLKKRAGILDGVCVTGGEPLINNDIADFLREVKALGYLIKLDTNGSFPQLLEELVNSGLVDYVAMDIKSSPENYPLVTGIEKPDMEKITRSVDFLKTSKAAHEFRTTVVKELHTAEDLIKISEWIKGEPKYFLQGFVDSGDIIGEGFSAYGAKEMESLLALVRQNVPAAELRGIN